MKMLSLIIPAHNEAENIPALCDRVRPVLASLGNSYSYELLFVNDGSTDTTLDVLKRVSESDSRIRYIDFSRNFGKEIATTAGLNHASGDACILIDADLQHPVELIPEFVKQWEVGFEVVVGVRNKSRSDSWVKKVGSTLFYAVLNAIVETKIVPNSTDFRLLDRAVVDEFNRLTEVNRMTRGLIDWLGFKRTYISFDANERLHGTASYNFWKLARLAFNSFVSLSLFPLRLAGYLGICITTVSAIAGFYILLGKYFFHSYFASTFSDAENLAIFIVFLVGILLMSIGLLSLYIENIHREVLGRPLYIMRKKPRD